MRVALKWTWCVCVVDLSRLMYFPPIVNAAGVHFKVQCFVSLGQLKCIILYVAFGIISCGFGELGKHGLICDRLTRQLFF